MRKFYKKKYRLIVPIVVLACGLYYAPNHKAVQEPPLRDSSWRLIG